MYLHIPWRPKYVIKHCIRTLFFFQMTDRAMEWIMIGVTKKDRVTNEDLKKKSRVQDIIKTIKSKKWRWAGHLARRHDNRWACKTTN